MNTTQRADEKPAPPAVHSAEGSAAGERLDELLGSAGSIQELPDVAARAPQGLQRGDPYQRLTAEVEDHRVPGCGGDLGGIALQAAPAEVRAGVVRRPAHRRHHVLLRHEAL